MRIGARLRNEDSAAAFDEVMRSDIRHNFCARKDFHVELLLDLAELLLNSQTIELV